MKLKDLGKYIGLFILAVAVIIVYKTFDNFSVILNLFGKIGSLLMPFFIGFAIAYILYLPCRKIEEWLQRTKVRFLIKSRRGLAVASIYVVFLAVLVLLLVAIIPAIIRSCQDFLQQLPSLLNSFITWFNSLDIYQINAEDITVQNLLSNQFFPLTELLSSFDLDNVNRYYRGVLSVGTWFFNAFMGIIISVYILLDRRNLKAVFERVTRLFIKEKTRAVLGRYLAQIDTFIHKYIYCMIIDAGIIFVLAFLALSVLQVKYAVLFALIVGLFNMIPYFGAIAATILTAVVTAFTGNLTLAVIVAAILVVLQQLDANLIQPRLLSDSLQIKPFWVIFGILLGGGLFGFLGIFLAVPIIALLRIILLDFMDLWERRQEQRKPQEEEEKPDAGPQKPA